MKKIISTFKYILLLLILCFSPFCLALVVESALTGGNVTLTYQFIMLPTLAGTLISAYIFRKENIAHIKSAKPHINTLICCAAAGISLNPLILSILHFAISLNINYGDMTAWNYISPIIVAPLAEEIIFRGLLTDILDKTFPKKKYSFILVILLTSLSWALIHLYGIGLSTLLVFIDGIILGFIYYHYKNIIYCIIYHSAVNASVLLMRFLSGSTWIVCTALSAVILFASVAIIIKDRKENTTIYS